MGKLKRWNEIPTKYKIILKIILIITGIILFLIYGIKLEAFSSLWDDLKSSASVLTYIIPVLILGIIMIMCSSGNYNIHTSSSYKYNGSTYDVLEVTTYSKKSEKQKYNEDRDIEACGGCMGTSILGIILLFLILVVLSLIEFLFPVAIGIAILVILYYLIIFIITQIFVK